MKSFLPPVVLRLAAAVWLVTALTGMALAETTKPIRMRVVDSASKVPLEGVLVAYCAQAREGTLTGHGGRVVTLFEVHARSTADGTITLAPAKFEAGPFGIFGMNTNYESPTVVLRKEGYKKRALHNSISGTSLAAVTRWELNGATVEMEWSGIDPARDAEEANFAAAVGRAHCGDALNNSRRAPRELSVRKAPVQPTHMGDATPARPGR